MSDYSILKLFEQEVSQQVGILHTQVNLLKTQTASNAILETSIGAIHKIYGMAHLVERDVIIELTEILEKQFSSLLNQNKMFSETQLELISQAGDLLLKMSQVSNEEWSDWLSEEVWELSTMKQAMATLGSTTEVVKREQGTGNGEQGTGNGEQKEIVNPLADFSVGEAAQRVRRSVVIQVKPDLEVTSEVIKPDLEVTNLGESNPISPELVDPEQSNSLQNSSMLDLFRLEVEAQVNIMNTGLLSLESNPTSAQDLEALMRSAHSIKGAARIVGLSTAVNLAHVMEDCFVAAQNHKIVLKSDQIDVLLQGVDQLSTLSQLSDRELSGWLKEHQVELQTTEQAIGAILNPTNVVLNPQREIGDLQSKEIPFKLK